LGPTQLLEGILVLEKYYQKKEPDFVCFYFILYIYIYILEFVLLILLYNNI